MKPLVPIAAPLIGKAEREAVDRVMRSSMLAQAEEVTAFEGEFARELVAGRECVAVSSGTTGLHLSLLAAGVGPGDEVVVPSFSFAATANAVALTGATPVFADIEPASYCLSPEAVASVLSPRTVGVMPVHLFGQPADMTRIAAVADQHGLAVFEDAAQAHGASWGGRPVGTFGSFAMFSLYATKNMTTGEGGMVTVADTGLARHLRLLRNQGMERRYENEIVGLNGRMTDLQAAIGRVQLGRLKGWTAARQANAAFYDEHLEGVGVPAVAEGATHVYHQYTVRIPEDRDGFAEALGREHGVGTGVFYPVPIHRLPSYGLVLDLPETERAAAEVLSLPVHPALTKQDRDRVVAGVAAVARAGS